jgi:hypothetical protein
MAAKQVPIAQTPANVTEPQANFNPKKFDDLLFSKGTDLIIERAMKCPCSVKGMGTALPGCKNCNGIGWFFINPIQTRMVCQGLGFNKKQEPWSELNTGMSSVTSRAIDRVAWMDRLTMIELESIFSENIRPKKATDNKLYVFPVYKPLEILDVFEFVSEDVELNRLPESDYTIDDNKIIFNNRHKGKEDWTLTIRYAHNPTYHIIDINRELIKTRTRTECLSDETLQNMPQHSMARKAHYMPWGENYDKSNIIYNA